jgi:hypothetical protein
MTYSTGEALILTRVRACTGFTSTNTSRSDWKILNGGKSDHYAILRPGGFTIVWQTLGMSVARYTTVIEVWQQYVDDVTSYSNLYTRVAALYSLLDYPHLGDAASIQDSTITTADEPEQMWRTEGGPAWLRWQMRVEWTEERTATFAE